jgi:hypothetical protein
MNKVPVGLSRSDLRAAGLRELSAVLAVDSAAAQGILAETPARRRWPW